MLRRGGTEILMVQYRTWWTLPGGGVEAGETPAEAACRELREETGLTGTVVRHLYTERTRTEGNLCVVYLVRVDEGAPPTLGHDPELPADGQHLHDVDWFPVEDKRDDVQVARVIEAMSTSASAPAPRRIRAAVVLIDDDRLALRSAFT